MWSTFSRTATLTVAALGLALTATAADARTTNADLPAPTQTGPATGSATTPPWSPTPPVLVAVRTGQHASYDRTVFDFIGGTPDFIVKYAKLYEEGTGALIPLAGRAPLHVQFVGAHTRHPVTGAGNFDLRRVFNPNLPTLRQVKFGGEFEAHIAAGLGLGDRVGFRAFKLANPPRVVVDVAHQADQPFGMTPVSRNGTAPDVIVERVRAGSHPGYDRLVFDIQGSASPTMRASYVGNGSTVDIGFTSTGAPTRPPHATFTGPQTVHFGLPELREVSFTIHGAGTMTARVTTAGRHGFRVMVFSSPTRVALDLAY